MSEEVRQRKVRIGDLLVQAGLISELQLQQALQEQKRTGSKLGRAVIDMGLVSEVKLLTALSEQLQIPFIELRHFKFDQNLVQSLPEAVARRFRRGASPRARTRQPASGRTAPRRAERRPTFPSEPGRG